MSRKILVVDDNDDVRELLLHILTAEGHEAIGASGAEDALALLDEHSFDLALLDVMMPGMSGIELLSEIRSSANSHRDIPIAMITALSAKDEIERALAAGANTYLVKPFRSADIRALLSELFNPQETKETV